MACGSWARWWSATGRPIRCLGAESTPGLDLEGCRLDQDLLLDNCRFQHAPVLRGAQVQALSLEGAHLPGLQADGLGARGSVFLHNVRAAGEVRLLGARIGGNLACNGGRFETEGGEALNADGLEARGDVFLRGVRASGEVRLVGARIGGDLVCVDGRFENKDGNALAADGLEARGDVSLRDVRATGPVRLVGAQIGGDLVCVGGQFANKGVWALNADRARVTGAFFWREGSDAEGAVDLTAAEIGNICDDPACWPKAGDLVLDRCRYGAFTGNGISAEERIRWLDLQRPELFGQDFWPQPWEQCAKVLREMGHVEEARQVLIAKEVRQRRARRDHAAAKLAEIRARIAKVAHDADLDDFDARQNARAGLVEAWGALAALRLRDGLLGMLIAYGHRPLRAIWWLVGIWLFGAVLFGVAWGDGGFKPNSVVVLRAPEWVDCTVGGKLRGDAPSTLACYLDQRQAAGYPRFNALLYSLDTLVPVVDLEVQDYWVPDERVAAWARIYLWFHIAVGWFLALLAVAGFTGLIDSRATKE